MSHPNPAARSTPLKLANAVLLVLRPVLGAERARQAIGYSYAVATLLAYSLKAQYGRTVLGLIWTLLTPLLFLAVYLPLMSIWMGGATQFSDYIGSGSLAFPIYVVSGFMAWVSFTEGLQGGAASVVSNPGVVHHSPIPLSLLPLVKVLASQIGLLANSAFLVLILACAGRWPGLRLLLFPVAFGALSLFCLGLALLLSVTAAYFRDLLQILPTLLLLEFFAAPLLYVPAAIQDERIRLLMELNPMTPFLNLFRATFIPEYPLMGRDVLAALALAGLSYGVGKLTFARLRFGLADHV